MDDAFLTLFIAENFLEELAVTGAIAGRSVFPHFPRALCRKCVSVRAVISLPLLRRLSWALVYLWAIAIFILSSLSGQKIEQLEPFAIWDKAAHFVAYTSGAVVLALALRLSKRWRWPKVVLVTAAFISFFGATDELHQLATPGRSGADVRDWAADTLGALAGSGFSCAAWAVYAARRKRREPGRLAPAAD